MIQYFKRGIGTLLLFLLVAGNLAAQDEQYFVYIQHERSQPFYVKYKGKLLSSSERGYIILSELPAGTLPITIGFPKNEAPEQQFRLRLGKQDQGFLLKHTDDKTYALYNLQTFSVTMAGGEGGESGRLVSLDDTGEADMATTPAPPAETAAPTDNGSAAMMADLRKDLDTTFAGKAEVTAVQQPVRERNPFAKALDKVVSDDRPDDISLEAPAPVPVATATGAAVAAGADIAPAGESRRERRKRNRDKNNNRAPLTEEEQALLQEVLAAERRAGTAADSIAAAQQSDVPEAALPVEQDQPVAAQPEQPVVTDASAYTEEATEKKPRKSKRKRDGEPEFIEFMDDATQQTAKVPVTAGAEAPAVSAEIASSADEDAGAISRAAKRKKKKLADKIEATEHPNNILTEDSVDYNAPLTRSSRKEKKDNDVKMINSDCDEVMDDNTFRKLLRKVVGAKDDEGMVAMFRKHVRDYCLETNQVRQLALLMSADEYRYRLLDLAYPKVYDSDKYASLSSVLSDSYYQRRFKAMLHK